MKKTFLSITIMILVIILFISCSTEKTSSNLNTKSNSNSTSPIDFIKIGKSYRFQVKSPAPRGFIIQQGRVEVIDREKGWIKLKEVIGNETSYPYFRIDDVLMFTEYEQDFSESKNALNSNTIINNNAANLAVSNK